ncbi:CAP domain-containing protein [Paenibacillus polymyxa]|uniref:CAP domain-containing protein n=1 Tax=Paenibacillus polymyxa TaxID=1406 RepID=UPI00287F5F84|nr:CAP domain-containing protein [Paenibacillus polymyxa]
MKKYIALAGILLATGCAANPNMAHHQTVPKQARVETPADPAAPAPTLTQASSIAAPGTRRTSISTKQVPDAAPIWLIGEENPAGNPAEQTVDASQFEQQVLQLVNKERAAAGLTPLGMDGNLSKMAMAKAQDMFNNNYFDHMSPTYGSPFEMMGKFGIVYSAAGENIAKGQTGPSQVMNEWMNSEGHKANILNSSFTKIGIAYFKGEWVQEFTG